MKRMSVEEFRNLGLLMEVNRLFLHPLGLCLEFKVADNGDMEFGKIQDYRDDPEGIKFEADTWFSADIVRAEYVESLRKNMLPSREKMFNNEDGIQPIPR